MQLRVTIINAMDIPRDKMGDYELFVKVKAGAHDEQTRKKDVSGTQCVWDQTLELHYEEGHDLKFELKDRDMIDSDHIGTGEIPASMIAMRDYDGEVRLTHHGRPAGFLRVRVNNPYTTAGGGMPGMGMPGMGVPGMGMPGMHPAMHRRF